MIQVKMWMWRMKWLLWTALCFHTKPSTGVCKRRLFCKHSLEVNHPENPFLGSCFFYSYLCTALHWELFCICIGRTPSGSLGSLGHRPSLLLVQSLLLTRLSVLSQHILVNGTGRWFGYSYQSCIKCSNWNWFLSTGSISYWW